MTLLPIGATPCPECPEPSLDGHKVTFMDYDGSTYYIMYVEDGGTAFPPEEDPDHSDIELIFDGWTNMNRLENVTEDIVLQAMYDTVDGKTLMFHEVSPDCNQVCINLKADVPSLDVTIDWGDGQVDQVNVSAGGSDYCHNYSEPGDKVTKFWVSNGSGNFSFNFGDII